MQPLGLKRTTVGLIDYQLSWPGLFVKEKSLIERIFNKHALQIEHIGSTAIPGLSAKPILDIAVLADHVILPDQIKTGLLIHHYQERPGRFFRHKHIVFAKGPAKNITHLLHILEKGNPQYQEYLLFRDYLIANKSIMNEYQTLKIELAQKYFNDREAYTTAKEQFIKSIIARAAADYFPQYPTFLNSCLHQYFILILFKHD